MKINKRDNAVVLTGNELFLMIGIVAAGFFCLGIYLLTTCIWPEDGIVDWLGPGLVASWTLLALVMALRSLNDALTQLELDENGVLLRRPLRKKRIEWRQVEDWGLSYAGIANHEDNAYELYFAEEPQREKNEYSRKLQKHTLCYTVVGEEYHQVVQEVLPYCGQYARVKPFVPEDIPHLM